MWLLGIQPDGACLTELGVIVMYLINKIRNKTGKVASYFTYKRNAL